MRKLLFSIFAVALPVFAMAQGCPPSSVTATVTLQFRAPGMLDGEFSVSATKKVNFSQGNLQYRASDGKWQFAEHQWDYIGNAAGNTTAEASRASQNAWIDLFGWATSGNPASNVYGYMPYYIVQTGTHYGPGFNTDAQWTPENSDWGTVNAVQLGHGWHTLSKSEWNFLLGTDAYSKRTNAENLRTLATVHGVPGLLLLPDDWTPENSRISTALTQNYLTNYTTNNISDADWTILEFEGAVFLPAAGYRDGNTVKNYGSWGMYWTSTSCSSVGGYNGQTSYAYPMRFNAGINYYSMTYTDLNSVKAYRYYGLAVRLVK